ncbi:hypothetical protein RUM44_013932 [Polyplax serrata]|uniref:Mitochondrial 2-oxodicarboxylate carrier n=1 Tax=Polyplax serrata TaxID=468196 RepID=A0ABR1BJ32_POLSC
MSEKSNQLLKKAALQITSGGSAGFVEVCIMHPLDLIKTRMQLQAGRSGYAVTETSHMYYNGILDCFHKMYKHEGLFSFYKGILPPILAETPKRAIKFFTFEQYKTLFLFGGTTSSSLTYSLAGACAGITEAIFVNPFEVVKVSLQSDRSKIKEYPSTWSVTKEIVQKDGVGLSGLNKGLSGTIARNGIFNMVYFGFYHSVQSFIPEVKDDFGKFLTKVVIGFVSGTLASCLNIPFDVAKSRIQGPQPVPGQVKYKKLLPTMHLIYIEEGWRAMYKGLIPKIMRLGPGGAIMLVVYDYTYQLLLHKFPN